MSQPLTLITDYELPGDALELTLTAGGVSSVRSPVPSLDSFVAVGKEASALIVQWASITAEVMDALPNLQFISRTGIGYDMIDVAAATERGIAVANTPFYCVEEVATHTLAMILSSSRGLIDFDRSVRNGQWSAISGRPMVARPSTTTVSVIGLGRIGSRVAAGCAALGFRVLVADPFVPDDDVRARGYEPVTRDVAISGADILTLHAPLTDETWHFLDSAALATMRSGSVVINTCRGALIDEAALCLSLQTGHLAGAALDVFEQEPLPATSPLLSTPGVALSPHAAWYSPEAMADLPVHAAMNVVDHFAGRATPAVVNPSVLGR
jgi:D-3-phosphoglycerate dehydrogenase